MQLSLKRLETYSRVCYHGNHSDTPTIYNYHEYKISTSRFPINTVQFSICQLMHAVVYLYYACIIFDRPNTLPVYWNKRFIRTVKYAVQPLNQNYFSLCVSTLVALFFYSVRNLSCWTILSEVPGYSSELTSLLRKKTRKSLRKRRRRLPGVTARDSLRRAGLTGPVVVPLRPLLRWIRQVLLPLLPHPHHPLLPLLLFN